MSRRVRYKEARYIKIDVQQSSISIKNRFKKKKLDTIFRIIFANFSYQINQRVLMMAGYEKLHRKFTQSYNMLSFLL